MFWIVIPYGWEIFTIFPVFQASVVAYPTAVDRVPSYTLTPG